VKVNVGTALNVAYTGALRDALAATSKVDPRAPLGAARGAVADTVARLLDVIGG
jgi:fructose-bisphosphate aldolase class II